MITAKQDYLRKLDKGLAQYPEKHRIIEEYDQHISELILEIPEGTEEEEVAEQIVQRLGSPEEIIGIWKEELSLTPKKTQFLFISINLCFFIGGGLLTLLYNLYELDFIETVWNRLTAVPTLIMILYLGFWGLLGYELGKGFGHSGKAILRKTFFISLVPNLILMYVTIFKLIPRYWFGPFLDNAFIVQCILFTLLLYPVCLVGFWWGKKASI